MKEKFKNLSAPVGIVLSVVAVILLPGYCWDWVLLWEKSRY